jgi:uncharacterized protein YraI
MWKYAMIGLGATVAFAVPAAADIAATAITDLNMRAGPGPQFAVTGLIKANDPVAVTGCIQASKWCTVMYGAATGWAYSDYLTTQVSGATVVLAQPPTGLTIPAATYNGPVIAGATVGAIVAGPAGAVVGGASGAVIGSIQPPPTVRTYITTNPGQVVYLNGEVVVGASLPQTVIVTPVPQYEYAYAYVNGVPVLVEPMTRRIVYIFRN